MLKKWIALALTAVFVLSIAGMAVAAGKTGQSAHRLDGRA